MAKYKKKFISLDLETTHLDSREGRIIEVGAVEVELVAGKNGVEIKFGPGFSSLVDPEMAVPALALQLTGIEAPELAAAPKWKEVKPKLKEFLGNSVLLGHNLGFDLGFIKAQGLNLKNEYWDTLELAQTLVPLAPSHSLESLAENFGVSGTASHRALEDCRSTARLLGSVLNEFLALPADLQKEIKEYLKGSKIGFRELILDLPEVEVPPSPARRSSSPARGEEGRGIDFDWPDKTILSLASGIADWLPAAVNRKKPGIVGLPHHFYLDFVPPEKRMASPTWALCEARLKMMQNREKLSDFERKVLIKTAILGHLTEHPADLREAKWTREERDLLHQITAEPAVCLVHRCAYARSLAGAAQETRFATLSAVMDLAGKWPVDFFAGCPLLLCDLAAAEDAFAFAATATWNLKKARQIFSWAEKNGKAAEDILNEADLFFGILHLVYRKRESEFTENLVADALDAADERFRKLFHPAGKFIGKLRRAAAEMGSRAPLLSGAGDLEMKNAREKLLRLVEFLESFFVKQDAGSIYWLRFNAESVDLNSAPRDLSVPWKKFAKKFSSITIADDGLPEAAVKYFQKRLGLENFLVKTTDAPRNTTPVPITIAEAPGGSSRLPSFLASLAGSSIVVLPGERQMGPLFEELQQAGGSVLAHKYSGPPARIAQKMTGQTILLLTQNAALRFWQEFPPARNLVVLKMPFEAPGSRLLPAGQPENFRGDVLPRAIYRLHSVLQKFLRDRGASKHIYLLDPRVAVDYDQEILRYLEDLPGANISTIDKL